MIPRLVEAATSPYDQDALIVALASSAGMAAFNFQNSTRLAILNAMLEQHKADYTDELQRRKRDMDALRQYELG
jgi:predicted phosphoribosyltransferase